MIINDLTADWNDFVEYEIRSGQEQIDKEVQPMRNVQIGHNDHNQRCFYIFPHTSSEFFILLV
jgi:hypothetical protein